MIYLKYSDKESGLYVRIASISSYLKAKLESPLHPKHLEQQLREKINCKDFGSRQVKAAK
jgi:hypothetical protein